MYQAEDKGVLTTFCSQNEDALFSVVLPLGEIQSRQWMDMSRSRKHQLTSGRGTREAAWPQSKRKAMQRRSGLAIIFIL
jgi:hypothetical protein